MGSAPVMGASEVDARAGLLGWLYSKRTMPMDTAMRSNPACPGDRELAVVWVVAIAIAVPVLLVALRAVGNIDTPTSEAFHDYNADRVEEFSQHLDDGAMGVVLFGDSRLRYGTDTQTELADRIEATLGSDVAVLKVVNDWGVLSDFDSLLPAIRVAGPDLVVFQEELSQRGRGAPARELLQREYLWWRMFGRGSWSPGDVDQNYLQYDSECGVVESLTQRRLRALQWVEFAADGDVSRRMSEVVDGFESDGIATATLRVPISVAAADRLPTMAPTDDRADLIPDVTIPQEQFCDLVHMDPIGRQSYTDWLVGALAGELRGQPSIR